MLELLLMIGVIVAMAKIASADDKSPIVWGSVTFALCVVSVIIPIPIIRVLIAFAVSFALMAVSNALAK